jgi:hypothetical protein
MGPNFTIVFNAQASVQGGASTNTVVINSVTPTVLTLSCANNRPIYWFVIGSSNP